MATHGRLMDGPFVRGSGVVERTVDDAVFLVGPENETVFHLNPLGAAVWRLLADPVSIDDVIGLLATAYPNVAIARIEADVSRLMTGLDRRGLIVRSD